MTGDDSNHFRHQLRRRPLVGTFVKTPGVHATEILADLGFDFIVVDEEHAPFDRGSIDLLMLATKASGIVGMVRVASETSILAALDMGAAGIVVPHVNSAREATSAVRASRYARGSRGFSPSPRSGRYGAYSLAEHIARADANLFLSVMIEHPDAVRNVHDIAAVEGVDALFLGLGDLAVASGELSADEPALRSAARAVCLAARDNGKALIAATSSVAAGSWLLDLGVNALVVSSDQGFLRSGATRQIDAFRFLGTKHSPST
jgi:2-keto-3-deoxy-L-rhamnonate aldolase RhmA